MSKLPPLPAGLTAIEPEPASPPSAAMPALPAGLTAISEPIAPSSSGDFYKGLARSAAQGISFGFSDEAEAWLRSKLGNDSYELNAAKIRDEIEAFAKANPKSALAAELVGAIAVPGLAAAKATATLARGAGLTGRVATGAAIGAAEGAVTGAGKAETGEAVNGAGIGTVVGGAIGGAVPVAGAVLRPIAESIGARIPVIADRVANVRANRAINEALEQDAKLSGHSASNMLTQAGETASDEIHRLRVASLSANPGERASIATTGGESVKRLASEVAQESPRAQRAIREYVDEVKSARPGQADYDALYAGKPVVSPMLDLLVMTRPALKQANAVAQRELANVGEAVIQGQFSPRHIDQIDRALQDAANRFWKAGANNRAAHLEAARAELRTVINAELPALTAIQAKYARGSEIARQAPKESEVVARDPTPISVANLLGGAVDAAAGRKLSLMRRVSGWLGAGHDEATAEAITTKLLTRLERRADLEQTLRQLERMAPENRRNYLVAFGSAGGGQAAGKVSEKNR